MVRKVGGTRKKAKVGAKKHTTRRRRRRVSGSTDLGGVAMKAGGLIAGAVIARELNTLIVGFDPTFSPLLSGAAQVVAGVFLPKLIKGPWGQNIGDGMIANGGMVVIQSTGLISGTNDKMAYRISGTSALRVINGTSRLPVVNGGATHRLGAPAVPSLSPPRARLQMPNKSSHLV